MSGKGVVVLSKSDDLRYQKVNLFISGKLTRFQVAQFLGISERSVLRIAKAISEKGVRGVIHGNRGREAQNKFKAKSKGEMRLVADRYFDFNMSHCLEMLARNHRIQVPYGVFRRWCHERKLVKRRWKRRSKARYQRARMPAEGYLIQMDASPDYYNGKDEWHLILGIDDATSEIPFAHFFESESTLGCMKVIQEIIKRKGIPRAVYTDRAGWSGGQKRTEFSQFKRACEELGTQVIFANSPEAKGRVERSFNTIHDRLIPELRLKKIKTLKAANDYLINVFLRTYWNRKNRVAPLSPESGYREVQKDINLNEIFCTKHDRVIGRDHVFSFRNAQYLILGPLPKRSLSGHYVEIRQYEGQPWRVYFQHHRLSIKQVQIDYKEPIITFEQWKDDFEESAHIKIPKNQFPEALGRKQKYHRDKIAEKVKRHIR